MFFGQFINHPYAQNNYFVKHISRAHDALTNTAENDKIVITKRLADTGLSPDYFHEQ